MMKTKEQISYNMKQVKCKDSEIERILRNELWKRGLRYRKNVKTIMGKPDIVFKRKKVAIFCDSEFWHGYDWEHKNKEIKTRREFWIPNIERDREVTKTLEDEGWTVVRFWGKQIKKDPTGCADVIEDILRRK